MIMYYVTPMAVINRSIGPALFSDLQERTLLREEFKIVTLLFYFDFYVIISTAKKCPV